MDIDKCSLCKHKLYGPLKLDDCGHIFCFTCSNLHDLKNTIYCPICKTQSVKFTLLSCQYCKKTSFINISNMNPLWVYEGRNYGWWLFDFENIEELEILYQHYIEVTINDIKERFKNMLNDNVIKTHTQTQNYKITIFKEDYNIDFENMKQISTSHTNRWRKIKRVYNQEEYDKMYIKGISGYSFI